MNIPVEKVLMDRFFNREQPDIYTKFSQIAVVGFEKYLRVRSKFKKTNIQTKTESAYFSFMFA